MWGVSSYTETSPTCSIATTSRQTAHHSPGISAPQPVRCAYDALADTTMSRETSADVVSHGVGMLPPMLRPSVPATHKYTTHSAAILRSGIVPSSNSHRSLQSLFDPFPALLSRNTEGTPSPNNCLRHLIFPRQVQSERTTSAATTHSSAMSKVDFEYYPHIVDLIWEHISDPCTVYTAGHVCSTWRKRAIKVIYRRMSMSAELDNGWWYLWMWAEGGEVHIKYLLEPEFQTPPDTPEASPASPPLGVDVPVLNSDMPMLDIDLAKRYTEVLDLHWHSGSLDFPTPCLPSALCSLSRVHTTRVHIDGVGDYFDAEGMGPTQVYFWFCGHASKIKIAAHNVKTLVLSISLEKPAPFEPVFDDVRLSDQLCAASYTATDVVIVFQHESDASKFRSSKLAIEVATYIGGSIAHFRITVVGAEEFVKHKEAYASFKEDVRSSLSYRSSEAEHNLRFLTHAEYGALVGPETYKLHCVPES